MNRIRAQRAFSVQTPEQYQFCLAALREVLRRKIMEEEESEEESENESDEEMSEDEDWNLLFLWYKKCVCTSNDRKSSTQRLLLYLI